MSANKSLDELAAVDAKVKSTVVVSDSDGPIAIPLGPSPTVIGDDTDANEVGLNNPTLSVPFCVRYSFEKSLVYIKLIGVVLAPVLIVSTTALVAVFMTESVLSVPFATTKRLLSSLNTPP